VQDCALVFCTLVELPGLVAARQHAIHPGCTATTTELIPARSLTLAGMYETRVAQCSVCV
jgi:hypothetical protein